MYLYRTIKYPYFRAPGLHTCRIAWRHVATSCCGNLIWRRRTGTDDIVEAVRFRVSTKGNGFLPRSNSIGKEPITLSAYPKSNSLSVALIDLFQKQTTRKSPTTLRVMCFEHKTNTPASNHKKPAWAVVKLYSSPVQTGRWNSHLKRWYICQKRLPKVHVLRVWHFLLLRRESHTQGVLENLLNWKKKSRKIDTKMLETGSFLVVPMEVAREVCASC